jgi:hypothetical protein
MENMKIIRIILLLFSLFLFTSFTDGQNNDTVDGEIHIPLKNTRPDGIGHFYVTVMINDVEVDLLIDCGSISSLLDINQSDELNFIYRVTESSYRGIGGVIDDYRVYKYRTYYGENELFVGFRGVDMEELMRGFNVKFKTNMVGVLGSNFFTSTNAVIDFKNRILIIKQ